MTLTEAYDAYIDLLEQECAKLHGLAFAHGYTCDDEQVQRGRDLRAAIVALKARVSQDSLYQAWDEVGRLLTESAAAYSNGESDSSSQLA